MYSAPNSQLPNGLIGVLEDLWPFLCHEVLGLESDPTSAEALQELANYGQTDDNDSLADSTVPWTSHPELFLDLPELSECETLSECDTLELDYGTEDYVPFLNVELGESFDISTLSALLAEIELSV